MIDQVDDIRASWEKAKEEHRLTGCGLIGNLTMEDIEGLTDQVEIAMSLWSRLAGTNAPAPQRVTKSHHELEDHVKYLEGEIVRLYEVVKSQRAIINKHKKTISELFEKEREREVDELLSRATRKNDDK